MSFLGDLLRGFDEAIEWPRDADDLPVDEDCGAPAAAAPLPA
jgi:hypothetical protein